MWLPGPELLGAFYCISETLISVRRRSRAGDADAGSLRLIWIVILCSLVASIVISELLPSAALPFARQFYPVGVLCFAAGIALRWYAIAHLGRFFTVDVVVVSGQHVVNTGPYRYLRHPAYSGALLAFLGFGLCFGNVLSLLVLMLPITMVFLRRIRIEEAALMQALGEPYRSYMLRTSRLIPWLY
jgi:protein-S-isoprenylcysteine O-methyltransferase